jgi:membrane protease YdiL (CAAX protease family)
MVDWNSFTSAKAFFSEWEDSKKNFSIFFILSILMLVLLFWIKTNIPSIASQADIFSGFALFGIIAAAVDYLNEKNRLFGFLFIGKDLIDTGVAFAAGLALAVVFTVSSFAVISTPLSAVNLNASLAAFIFVVIVAPYVEELFFRMALYPTLIVALGNRLNHFQAGIISALFVSGAFALFHYAVFSAGFALMIAAFLFSLIAIMGNRLFASTYFSYGLHLGNNFIAFGGLAALAGLGLAA